MARTRPHRPEASRRCTGWAGRARTPARRPWATPRPSPSPAPRALQVPLLDVGGADAPGLRPGRPRCPRCAGRMELIATIDDPAVIVQILAHLEVPGARDGPAPAPFPSPPRDDQPTLPFALP